MPDQPESTQYSRTLAVKGGTDCPESKLDLKLAAWVDVPSTVADRDYDGIRATGRLLDNPAVLPHGSAVWFSYTVFNDSQVTLTNIQVADSHRNPVCTIADLNGGVSVGCARRKDMP
ncbi:MAG: hypothetical protein LBJ62_01835 [Bifidobacteriaceae bacterium]|nr:hypothetical protein [Bifidobacteriaceae bacterium]